MPTKIVNAAPMTVMLGIQDNSTVALAVTPEEIPTHLPKIYLYAQKGPLTPQLVGSGKTQMYGLDTFDMRKQWANHATELSNRMSAAGNAQMIERLVPSGAGPKANMLLSLDVLPTTVPTYQRDSSGNYILDSFGAPLPTIPSGTVPGFKCKWVVTHVTSGSATDADSTLFGQQVSGVGDQTANSVTSTRYPILEFWASSFGGFGNNAGIRLWAPTANDDQPVDQTVLNALKAYPFRLAMLRRANASSTAKLVPMVTGDLGFEFVLEANTINPVTDGAIYLGDLFGPSYNSHNPGYDPVFADLSGIHIYQNYINTLTALFYAAEKAIGGAGSDFDSAATDEQWKFNFVSGKSSFGAPYHSFVLNTADANAVTLTESTSLWAAGGSDGTMTDAAFAALVSDAVLNYADPLSSLQNTAVNVESIIYDTGFPLQTKKDLCSFISQRKDTFVVLSTYDVNGAELSEADEAALAITLRTQLQLFPESTYFGTPTCRGLVMARYGTMLGTQYSKKLPLTLELAIKSAAFMGAGNGVWNKSYLFDHAPASEVTNFKDLNVSWVPGSQRNVDWDNGLNYPIDFSRDSQFFPALKTAYGDDTSVLTSFFTAMACVQLEKVGEQVWREFSGMVSLTEAQLVSRVNKSVQDKVQGKFAGLFKIVPNCTITASDAQRGYSWTLPIQIYANNMKSVMVLSVQAFRMSQAPTN